MIFAQISIYCQGTWTHTDLSLARERMEAVINGSNIYFAGGQTDFSQTQKIDIYEVTSGQWSTTNLSLARSFPTAASLGNKVLFAGGMNPHSIARVDIFDKGTSKWSTATLSKARFSMGTAAQGSKILFAGGADLINYNVFNTVDIYDINSNSWEADTLSVARAAMGTTVVGSKAYFGGGYMLNSKCSDRIDIYDFTTGKWESATLPLARGFLAATSIGKKILFAGGMTEQNLPTDRVDIYDTESKTWTLSSLSEPRAFFSNAATVNGKAYFAGGMLVDFITDNIYGFYNIVDIYDANTGKWSTQSLSNAINGNVVIGLGSKLYSAGGRTENGVISTVDIYNSEIGKWSKTDLSQYKDHMAYTVLGDKVYFAGGYSMKSDFSGQFSTDKVEIYDINTGNWVFDKLSKGRDWLEGTSAGSKVIFAGGWDDVGNLQTTVDIYDTLTKKWSIANLSIARRMLSPVSDGKIVMFAGGMTTYAKTTTRVDIYEAQTGIWKTSELSESRLGISSASCGDLIFFAGGLFFDTEPGSEIVYDVVDIYNTKTNTWTTSKLSSPRFFIASAVVGDKVIFAGGQNEFGEPSNRVDIYDTVKNQWSIDSLSVPRAFDDNDQNSAVVCGRAYFVGGMTMINGNYLSDYKTIDIYDPVTKSWETDELPYNLFGHSVAGVGNKLVVAGGMSIYSLGGFDIHKEVLIFECVTSKTIEPGTNYFYLNVFPNPTSSYFTLDMPEYFIADNAIMTICDLYGRVVIIKKGEELSGNHDISLLPNGIYIVSVISKNTKSSGKLIKE